MLRSGPIIQGTPGVSAPTEPKGWGAGIRRPSGNQIIFRAAKNKISTQFYTVLTKNNKL